MIDRLVAALVGLYRPGATLSVPTMPPLPEAPPNFGRPICSMGRPNRLFACRQCVSIAGVPVFIAGIYPVIPDLFVRLQLTTLPPVGGV